MPQNPIEDQESYRDHIATVDEKGKRVWIYPKKPSGRYYNARTYLSWVLLALLFGMPFVKIHGDPILLFNVLDLRFILFGIVFTPQDLHLFALAMITFVVFIVLFTVVFGRLFCGWVCPQTIFMEMVFRKIEYAIEGDANQQRKLNISPWTTSKIQKKVLKHVLFYLISFLIANTFLAYIIGIDQLKAIISEPVSQHMGGFIALLIFSAVFYFVFAKFREQVCIAVCPYGRLQSVMLVKESIVVAYDWIRGEPRGKIRKKQDDPTAEPAIELGDCIDCKLCVQVCPTGIDIRNGTQLECVNCTACMDACDEVMTKVNRDTGLIRYDSIQGIETGQDKIFTGRVKAYSLVLMVLVALQIFLFSTRSDVQAVILRTPGMLYQEIEGDYLSNLYNYQLINKTAGNIENISLQLKSPEGRIRLVGELTTLGKESMSEGAFFVEIHKDVLTDRKTNIRIEVYSGDELLDEVKTNFLGPPK